jgi:glycyl-tRNA synthetase
MHMVDPATQTKVTPYVIEPAVGLDRLVLAFLTDAYQHEPPPAGNTGPGRWVLRLHPALAPIRYAVLPLVKKEPLLGIAQDLFQAISASSCTDFDMAGSVGRRYRRQV